MGKYLLFVVLVLLLSTGSKDTLFAVMQMTTYNLGEINERNFTYYLPLPAFKHKAV